MTDRRPWELLVRHAAGRVTPTEKDRVAEWSAGDAEHATLLRRVHRLVELSRAVDAADHTMEAWHRLERRMAEQGAETRVLPVHVMRSEPPVRPTRASRKWWRGLAAAAAAAVLVVGAGARMAMSRLRMAPEMREIVTRRGERLELGLPDGSRVILGPASRLRLAAAPAAFTADRRLLLDGEGYFTVAHDTAHPFVVRARGASAQAVGTAFGVRAYAEDSVVQVAVSEGRVLLQADAAWDSVALLGARDVGAVARNGGLMVRRGVEPGRYLGWTTGEITFERTPLAAVLRELGRAYDIDLALADSLLASVPVTATFRHQAADDVARTLAELLDMRVGRDGRARLLLQATTRRGP